MSYISTKRSNALYKLCTTDSDSMEHASALAELKQYVGSWERPDETETAREIADMLNVMGFSTRKFSEAMGAQHRTLQQSFTRTCLSWLQYLSEQEHFDLRNEASVKMAKQFMKLVRDGQINDGLPHV